MQALRIGLFLSIVFAVFFGEAARSRAENWPQFRGPTGSGQTGERNLPITWGGENQENVAWKTPLIVGDHVYRLHTPGVLKCWSSKDGRQVYAQRLDGISTTWASPIVDGNGRIYYANAGKSFVIRSGPQFELLGVNDLGDGNHPSPAVADGRMFLVGMKNVYCIRKE